MPFLDCTIAKNDWAQEVVQRDGISPKRNGQPEKKLVDAGPWEPAVQKILGFLNLGEDWDGFGAEAPSDKLVESAIGLANLFCEWALIHPTESFRESRERCILNGRTPMEPIETLRSTVRSTRK